MKTLQKVRKITTPGKILDGSMHVEQEGSMLQIRRRVQKMGLKYIKEHEFEKGKEEKWPKHKAKAAKEGKKEDNND